jgi:voltage-gated hydrogen channel 1
MSTEASEPLLGRQGQLLRPFVNPQQSQASPDSSSRVERSRRNLRQLLTSRGGHYAVLALVSLDVTCIFAGVLPYARHFPWL